MPVYEYKAVNGKGEKLEGSYTAATREEVIKLIRQNNNYPLSISEAVRYSSKKFEIQSSIKLKDIAILCRQFYAMLNAGVTIVNCLEILRTQTENRKLGKVLDQVYEEVQKGKALSETMKLHDRVFPELLVSMVEAGELSGSLDTVMERMALHYEKEAKLANKVKSAMVYPMVLMTLCIVVVIFMLTFVMPTFLGMFEGSGVPLPLPTRILIGISDALLAYWYLFLLVIALIVLGLRRYYVTESGRLFFDELKLQMPLFGKLNRKVATARFTRTLSSMMTSGIPLIQALESISAVVGNRYIGKGILRIKDDVRKGMELSTPIRRSKLFPPMVDSMVKIGEESGTLDEIMAKTADFFEEEVDVTVTKLIALMEPLMIVFMAIIIGGIVIAMVLPMFDMINTVQ